MRKAFWKILGGITFGLALGVALGGHALADDKAADDQVVYHIDDAQGQALKALRNIRNHLDTDPHAKITVVAHAQGVDFLLQGAKDGNGSEYAGPVSALASRGVRFEVCEITLGNRHLDKNQFLFEASFTPSGVVRIAKLQQQGAAYIKP